MSGVIVERRDHVLITGGRCPPARAFSTAFKMPLSMNGPFLTERAIRLHLHCRFPISNCQFEKMPKVFKSAIGNRQLAITWFYDPSESSSESAYCCVSCNREWAGPRASPDFFRLKFCPHHHRAGGPPGSSPRRELSDANLSNAIVRPYPAKRSHARCCRPGPPSLCKPKALVAPHPRACAIVHTRLPSPPTARRCLPSAPSDRLFRGAIRYCESACPAGC